ncbi:MAG: CoA pyrophosphatase [Rubricella sp.]
MENTDELRAKLRAALARGGSPSSDYDLNPGIVAALPGDRRLRRAAVLVPVVAREAGATLLLTRRSAALKHHPGQIAFPGGKIDENDDGPVAAALREAREEVGLPDGHAEVLGAFAPHETVTGFTVEPVIALVAPFDPVPEPGEVEEVFEVPLSHVTDPARFHIRSRQWRGKERRYYIVPWGPYYIWGATARMLRQLADMLAR